MIATATEASPAQCALTRNQPSRTKIVSNGSSATSAERVRLPRGARFCWNTVRLRWSTVTTQTAGLGAPLGPRSHCKPDPSVNPPAALDQRPWTIVVGTGARSTAPPLLALTCCPSNWRTEKMDLGLAGRTALVCASTSGLGLATARALAAEGATVVVNGRSADRARKIAAELPGAVGVGVDLVSPGGAERLLAQAREAVGDIDVLVLNGPGPA